MDGLVGNQTQGHKIEDEDKSAGHWWFTSVDKATFSCKNISMLTENLAKSIELLSKSFQLHISANWLLTARIAYLIFVGSHLREFTFFGRRNMDL